MHHIQWIVRNPRSDPIRSIHPAGQAANNGASRARPSLVDLIGRRRRQQQSSRLADQRETNCHDPSPLSLSFVVCRLSLVVCRLPSIVDRLASPAADSRIGCRSLSLPNQRARAELEKTNLPGCRRDHLTNLRHHPGSGRCIHRSLQLASQPAGLVGG